MLNSNQTSQMKIAFFGSSLVSSYWNGAATYYRGMIKALSKLGHHITFYEPDILERQKHRDMEDPTWAKVVVYQPDKSHILGLLEEAADADIVVKASGVGVLDEWLERQVAELRSSCTKIFWDVDAPATLERVHNNSDDLFRRLIPQYDLILTYGGGQPVVSAYEALGAQRCEPIYNAFDPDTHHPVVSDLLYEATMNFLGNRLPDREARVHEYFFKVADAMPTSRFILGGSGWDSQVDLYPNIDYFGHVSTAAHNVFNCSPLAVLNIARDSMARVGFSPATRVFEAAGVGACVITDAWEGIEQFLQPGEEILVAHSGDEVVELLRNLSKSKARQIGIAARKRILAEHTYQHRALQFAAMFEGVEHQRASA